MAALIQFNDNTAHSRLWLSENENEAQALFAQCKSANINPVCQCSIHTPAMYIAQRKKYYLARMPGTGSKHAPNCPSFEVESQDKGTTVYDKSVIRTNNNGSLTLKIHAPLSRTKVVREQNSELNEEHTPTPQIPRNKNAKRDAMSLSATLGIIWEQAELNRWHPNFTGKRSWWLFRTRMLQAAENIVAKRKYLNGVLGILPPNTAKTVEGPVFTGLQATINFNLARVSVSSSAFGSKNEQNQATINSHCR